MTFDYVIFAGGRLPPLSLAKRLIKLTKNIITVDRGAELALELKVKPLLHVGDGDSFEFSKVKKLRAGAVLRLPPKKSISDLEYALEQLDETKTKLVLGAHLDFEGRSDHAFINLVLLSQQRNLYFADEIMWATKLTPNKVFTFVAPLNTVFSVVSLDSKKPKISISGAAYNSTSKVFTHATEGLSNITRSKTTKVKSTGQMTLLFVAAPLTQTKIDDLKLL